MWRDGQWNDFPLNSQFSGADYLKQFKGSFNPKIDKQDNSQDRSLLIVPINQPS